MRTRMATAGPAISPGRRASASTRFTDSSSTSALVILTGWSNGTGARVCWTATATVWVMSPVVGGVAGLLGFGVGVPGFVVVVAIAPGCVDAVASDADGPASAEVVEAVATADEVALDPS